MPIATLDDLRAHLQWAIELEHATIPPYLCALYSIRPGTNPEARETIASVFVEEMLHMTLAANVLNALGGRPVLDRPEFLPRYPAYLPHSADAFLVPLARFSPATVETFLKIEKPEDLDAPPEGDRFHTIGQFYLAIEEALRRLCETLGESAVFSGDPARQVTPDALEYTGSGQVIAVTDLASALAAIDEIEEQGEGQTPKEVWDGDRDMFHPEREEVAHYFRFQEILAGRAYRRGDTPASGPSGPPFEVDWTAVFPMRDNPKSADYAPGSPVRVRMDAFNLLYCDVLRSLERAFDGEPGRMFEAVGAMRDLTTLARDLMQLPNADGATTAGPSFEYVARPAAAHGDGDLRIRVTKNGPYVVEGPVPLTRKSIVYSEWHEPMSWRKDAELAAEPPFRLCRCGQSKRRPFCDGTHAKVGFDGAETASVEPSASRQRRVAGVGITVTDDAVLCSHAGFCGNRVEKVWKVLERSADSRARFEVIQRVERCPSGRLGYEVPGGPVEPDLPRAIAVTRDGPYWVTGGIRVELSDGRELELRSRVELCRCGKSANKPFCDGTHVAAGFREG